MPFGVKEKKGQSHWGSSGKKPIHQRVLGEKPMPLGCKRREVNVIGVTRGEKIMQFGMQGKRSLRHQKYMGREANPSGVHGERSLCNQGCMVREVYAIRGL